ncbi:MAG: recombination protein RecR [Tepidiforma sp.]|nr:MAG: recombination protein RecR [Tepidiforma sp.]
MPETSATPEPILRLVEALHRLPGIGPKSAQRLAYHLVRAAPHEAEGLARALLEARERIRYCSRCVNLTERDPCAICADPRRDQATICVVEQPLDVVAVERSGIYRGVYHVLHGILNPMEGIGPEHLHIDALVARVAAGDVREVIMATNPSLEGEATVMYVQRVVAPHGVRVTRLARGLPSGADLEYADTVTLARALEGRQEL